MSALGVLRDDGPLARRAFRALDRSEPGPLAWLVPPLVRAGEYGGLIALTVLTNRGALPACFAFLAVLAFHHYDLLYRLRSGREATPRWACAIAGGWEMRLAVAAVLAWTDVLEPALITGAVGLGALFATESWTAWIRSGRRGHTQAVAADVEAPE